jgi:hypothetical protein
MSRSCQVEREEAVTVEDPELNDLCQSTSQLPQENREPDQARGSGGEWFTRTQSAVRITFRVKPDRRAIVTHVDPAHERRLR